MIHRLETEDYYFTIQEIKEKLEIARSAIRYASDNLRRLEILENDTANKLISHQNKIDQPDNRESDLLQFNKLQQDITVINQNIQSHQDNINRWRKEMGDIINNMLL